MEGKPLEFDEHWIWFWGPDLKGDEHTVYGSEKFFDHEVMKGYSAAHSEARKSLYPDYWSDYIKVTNPKE